MSLSRFRLRSITIVVAVLALLMGFGIRSARLRNRAYFHYQQKLVHSSLAALSGRCGLDEDLITVELTPDGASIRSASPQADQTLKLRDARRAARKKVDEKLSAYHALCARRFRHAAFRPWLAVSIDPPPIEAF